jgi:excisionase family DNA binding protein
MAEHFEIGQSLALGAGGFLRKTNASYTSLEMASIRSGVESGAGGRWRVWSRSKLYELIAAGQLKAVKLGSRTLILHSELVRFLTTLSTA